MAYDKAESLYGYITKIMRMSEAELSLPVTAAGLQPIHILRGMTQLLLDRAQRRAGAVNSPGTITPERVIAIYNSRVLTY